MIQVATIISFGELGFGGFLSQWAGCDQHKLSYCCHAEVWDLFGQLQYRGYDKDQVHTKTAVNITNSPRLRFFSSKAQELWKQHKQEQKVRLFSRVNLIML